MEIDDIDVTQEATLARAAQEATAIARVAADGSARHAVVPVLAQEPVGADRLGALRC